MVGELESWSSRSTRADSGGLAALLRLIGGVVVLDVGDVSRLSSAGGLKSPRRPVWAWGGGGSGWRGVLLAVAEFGAGLCVELWVGVHSCGFGVVEGAFGPVLVDVWDGVEVGAGVGWLVVGWGGPGVVELAGGAESGDGVVVGLVVAGW
jgi:hypothetical protein